MANAYYSGLTRRISWRSLHAILTDTDGAALIEITLFVPFLALTSVAIINFGLYFWYQTEVVNAAQAGAQWAISNPAQTTSSSSWSSAQSAIQNTVNNANNSSHPSVFTAITVPSTCGSGSSLCIQQMCGCISGSTLTLSTPWAPSCTTAASCGTYVQAVASGTFTPFAKFGSFFRSSYTVASTATVRVQ
jgi:hypothetical protein